MTTGIRAMNLLTRAFGVALLSSSACLAQTPKTKPAATAPKPAPAATKSTAVPGATKKAASSDAADAARMKQLLKLWEKESAKLTSLDVGIERVDESPLWGKEPYKGRAIFQSPNLAWLDFKKVQKNEKGETTLNSWERIVCSGNDIWWYKTDTKEIYIFPIERKDQKRVLEEGPLPFLFNMKAAEAEARYQMDLVNEAAEYYVISVLPKFQYDQDTFVKAFLKLNKKTFFPDEIFLISPDGKSSKRYLLNGIQRNVTVDKAIFIGKPVPKWSIRRDVLAGDDGGSAKPKPAGPTQGRSGNAAAPASTTTRRK